MTCAVKADRGPPDIRKAIRIYLANESFEEAEAAVKEIVKLCRSNCGELFIPGAYYVERPWETTDEFVRDWVADHLAQLHEPDLARLEEFDYWPHACRRDLLNEIAKAQRKLAVLNPFSLDHEKEQEDELFKHDPCESYWTNHEVKLTTEVAEYCEENLGAFKKLGKIGETIIAFAKAFPARPSAKSIAGALGVGERQALRYLDELPLVMKREIDAGNPIVRGLFALLRTGDAALKN
jgi:hypothetical protein